MIPKKVIEKAKEAGWLGGYDYKEHGTEPRHLFSLREEALPHQYRGYEVIFLSDSEIALDPTFWQCLGKVWGWECYEKANHGHPAYLERKKCLWNNAHRFYDLILTNQPTEPFWDSLIN